MMSVLVDAFPPPLERFVRAVHRRQVLLRVLERAGLGVLAGCAVAVVMVGVMLWRGQDAWAVVGIILGVGAVAGACWGGVDRPSTLGAATEADRQFGTADLLGTAWTLHADAANPLSVDPFRETVLALAAARCRTLSPSGVLLRRLGARAWGGIALAVAFVATLAALSDRSARVEAADGGFRPRAVADVRQPADRPIVQITPDDGRLPRRVERNPADEQTAADPLRGAPPDRSADDPDEPRADESDNRTSSGASPGSGAGDARTNAPDPSRQHSPDAPVARIPPASMDGRESGGAGRGARRPLPAQITTGGTVAGQSASSGVPPPTATDWARVAETARQAVESGQVPDEYRDLVRGYFDPAKLPQEGAQRE